ncbi:MAG: preprotein translocase subunit SecA [Bacteroidota bacterium]|nr:preprotein translocase subunit SecA [Bacteroidota bacterium]MDW8138427.1 preprotein translocase subunit SecA [Bacteroidota bacterium]
MLKLLTKLLGSKHERDIKKLMPLVEQINRHYERLQALSDEELRAKTEEFKARIRQRVAEIESEKSQIEARLAQDGSVGSDGRLVELSPSEREALYAQLDELEKAWLETVEETLDELLPEAYAVVKEACRRLLGRRWTVTGHEITWDMVPFDVQLIGAIVLHQGKIAEMKTGEGKTLVAIMPAYLNALAGRGVHIVTVNDYLARRDAEWMGPIYEFLGLTVDCIDRYPPNTPQRRKAYEADVTYGTNNEFGFDYLRDNMALRPDQIVQRGHHYAIIDEVDSILIDEARTPLIISGPVPVSDENKFIELKPRVERLVYAQQRLVAQCVADAKRALDAGDTERAGLLLFRAHRGFPRNKQLMKMRTEDGAIERLIQKTELYYLQEQGKNMHIVDEELYFVIDEKHNTIELTEKGRQLITEQGEDPEFFVIPDLGTETAKIEQEFQEQKRQLEERLRNDPDLSEEKRKRKWEQELSLLRKEKEERLQRLYQLYAERAERIHAVEQLLRAYTLFEKDVEYIVQDGKVLIVDEHTGRILPGRRYSDGLHQAIEAKENVKVEAATQTYATITLQNYFRMYHKLAGMTGTAETEAAEFYEIYKLDVVVIPTHKPVIRIDKEDVVFRTKREKYNAIIEKIREYHQRGQPVLVGTTSVEVSETLSRMLQRAGIPHNVLNAKHHQREAEIIAQAGQRGAVTIATNMAGRGTDIKLGPGVRELGGLAIVGSERHESRRIDNQLRGRAGRQGDPGESQFFVSLEDDLMRLFGSDRIAGIMERFGMKEGETIQHPMVTRAIERAQKRVEQNHFAIRKRQLEFDDVLNKQRQTIYELRRNALLGRRVRADLEHMLEDFVHNLVARYYPDGDLDGLRMALVRHLALDLELDREQFLKLGEEGVAERALEAARSAYRRKEEILSEDFFRFVRQIYESPLEQKPEYASVLFTDGSRFVFANIQLEEALRSQGHELLRALERATLLSFIDERWTEHLRDLDELREGIHLRAYGQKDPLLEYKMDAFDLFRRMMERLGEEVISFIWRAMPAAEGQAHRPAPARPRMDLERARATHESLTGLAALVQPGASGVGRTPERPRAAAPGERLQPVVVGEKIGRNEPCPCGSGKKYKHCHGRFEA